MSVRKERTTKEMKKNQGMDGVLFSALASIGGHHGVTIGVERIHELVHMGYSCKEGHGRMNRWREEVEPIG
ncbi:hypothetical protein EYC84_001885 [Monilinia fructicola]|uniref:Uncharacterized protein n=1 Tax=Monilinia fructicola TaxID=38448 RepID=A0A5M9JTJ7_MONFR|nr:hypothetical protein EYC84_001885 [Monilinia fructicola]